MKFENLNLDERLLSAIRDMGYEKCTPVQEQSLPETLLGSDISAQAQTGTGKTAVFLITVIQRLIAAGHIGSAHRALVLVPTRELAVQVETQAIALCKYLPFKAVSIYGGVGYDKQRKALSEGAEILVATPGRLIDYIKGKEINLSSIAFFIIDEADRMFDMGFTQDVRYIYGKVPPKEERQSMIFSATLDFRVRRLAETLMRNPVEIEIDPEQITVEKVDQRLYHVSREEKIPLLLALLAKEGLEKVIIFTNMKRTAEEIHFRLERNGMMVDVLTGDVDQKKRLRVIEKLKEGKVKILVATDVAARGLHIDGISHVINYDIPTDAANYVHRIGRTARAGAHGIAYTIACEDLVEYLPELERFIDQKIRVEEIDFDLLEDQSGFYRSSFRGGRPAEARKGGAKPSAKGNFRREKRGKDTSAEKERPKSPPATKRHPRPKKKADAKKPVRSEKKMSESDRLAYYSKKYGESFSKQAGDTGTKVPHAEKAPVAKEQGGGRKNVAETKKAKKAGLISKIMKVFRS